MALEIPSELIAAFPPSGEIMLDCLRPLIDDSMLMEIARADYGMQADERFAELLQVRDDGIESVPIESWLLEVLQLSCGHDPDGVPPHSNNANLTGRRGHLVRAYACSVLLRDGVEPRIEYIVSTEEATLARWLVSLRSLGEKISEAAACFLVWRVMRCQSDDVHFFAVGLLLLAIRLRSERFSEAELGRFADWVVELDPGEPRRLSGAFSEPPPLALGICYGMWQPLYAELLAAADAIHAEPVRTSFQLCCLLIERPF